MDFDQGIQLSIKNIITKAICMYGGSVDSYFFCTPNMYTASLSKETVSHNIARIIEWDRNIKDCLLSIVKKI